MIRTIAQVTVVLYTKYMSPGARNAPSTAYVLNPCKIDKYGFYNYDVHKMRCPVINYAFVCLCVTTNKHDDSVPLCQEQRS